MLGWLAANAGRGFVVAATELAEGTEVSMKVMELAVEYDGIDWRVSLEIPDHDWMAWTERAVYVHDSEEDICDWLYSVADMKWHNGFTDAIHRALQDYREEAAIERREWLREA